MPDSTEEDEIDVELLTNSSSDTEESTSEDESSSWDDVAARIEIKNSALVKELHDELEQIRQQDPRYDPDTPAITIIRDLTQDYAATVESSSEE